MLRTEVVRSWVTVQDRCVDDAGTGVSVSLCCCTPIIEALTSADFVGVPGSGSGIKVGGSRDGRHRRG